MRQPHKTYIRPIRPMSPICPIMSKTNPMQLAIEQAKTAAEKNEVPVGAVLVENGKIIAVAHNQNISLNDPTAHAEILVLREACKIKNQSRLDGCDLYVTLEPCAMCAAAISLARIRRVYYSIPDKKFGAVENGARIFQSTSCHHFPEVYSGFHEKESQNLLQNFFKLRR